jgi:hypothetical protein
MASRKRIAAPPVAIPTGIASSQTTGCLVSLKCLRLGTVQRLAVSINLSDVSTMTPPEDLIAAERELWQVLAVMG